jgi:hypothetical protein
MAEFGGLKTTEELPVEGGAESANGMGATFYFDLGAAQPQFESGPAD